MKMPKATLQSRLVAAILARGYVEDHASRVTRYRVFRPTGATRSLLKPEPNGVSDTHRVYSGRMGALRFSVKGTVAGAIPFSDRMITRLLDEANAGGIDAYEAAMRAARNPTP